MKTNKSKIIFLDNLKVFLIALVVAHHVAQGYQLSVEDWLIPDPDKTKWLSLLISPNATYFMGLFFFISAYFLPRSYEERTPANLFKKKVLRLGVPAILTVLFILPPSYYLSKYGFGQPFFTFLKDWFFTQAHFSFGHTWFIVQLLVYSSIFICFNLDSAVQDAKAMQSFESESLLMGVEHSQKVKATPIKSDYGSKNCVDLASSTAESRFRKSFWKVAINHKNIALYTLALFATTWLVSLKFPQGDWFFYHLVEPYRLPQYISLFVAGIIAYENNWLQTLPRSVGYTWLGIGVLFFAMLVILKIESMSFTPLGYTLWSSVMCSSWCVGLITLFRDCCNAQTPLLNYLARNSYTVYLVHVLPVIAMQRLLLYYSLPGMVKFFIAFVASYLCSYLLASFLRLCKKPFIGF